MVSDKEIYKAAVLLIGEFGDMAANGAFIKADRLRDMGDVDGHALWTRVAEVTEDLLSTQRPENTPLN